ncbi:tape measure protein [Pseudomonas sp. Marseille-QA0892]
MADVELRIVADMDNALKGVSGFRKEYQDLVRAIAKPIRQIDAFQQLQQDAKKSAAEFFSARRSVDALKEAMKQAGQDVKGMDRQLVAAERSLAKATLEFDRQKTKVREQRAELRAAGVDVRNLAGEQKRLQESLAGALGKGRADRSIAQAMDTFGVTQLRNLRTQLVALQADYKRLGQSGQMSATERAAAEIRYQAKLAETKRAINEMTNGTAVGGGEGIAGVTARLAAITGVAYAVQRTAGAYFNIADAVNTLEDRMKNALPVHEEYERAQERLERISKSVRTPIQQTSELFLGVVGPLKEMGYSTKTATDLVGALSAGLVANSVKGQQAASVIDQFNKGLQTGVIRGDAFNAILQNSQALTGALQRGLGVTRAELIRMANAGELTTERVVTAFTGQAEALLKLTDAMRNTTEDGRTTLSDSISRVVKSIDDLLGVSDEAVKELDRISDALDQAAKGDGKAIFDTASVLDPYSKLRPAAITDFYRNLFSSAVDANEKIVESEKKAAVEIEAANERKLAAQRAYATQFNSIQEGLKNSFETALRDQIAAQTKANSKLEAAKKAQLDTEKRYNDALEKLRVGATGPASFGNAQRLQYAANQALQSGDVERAKKNAQDALKMLLDLAEAGENTYGFEGFIKSLQAIEQEADKVAVDKAEKARQVEIDKVREFKKEFEELKNFKITPSIDDDALAKETAKMQRWAKMIGKDLIIEPRSADASVSRPSPLALPKDGQSAVPVAIKPVAVDQPATAPKPVVEAEIKPSTTYRKDGPNSFTNLPDRSAAQVAGIRQDGSNGFTNLPPVKVDIQPAGIRQDGENSFTNLPPVPVDIAPKGISQEGDKALADLPPVDVGLELDKESAAQTSQAIEAIAQEFKRWLTVPVTLAGTAGAIAARSAGADGFATGGWTGPGSKYQPAGIVHADEHVQPKRVVNEPGALPFLERVRRNGFQNTMSMLQQRIASGMRGYAEGGLVGARMVPAIPQMDPSLLGTGASSNEDWGTMVFDLGGYTHPIKMPRSVAEEMRIAKLKRGRTHTR